MSDIVTSASSYIQYVCVFSNSTLPGKGAHRTHNHTLDKMSHVNSKHYFHCFIASFSNTHFPQFLHVVCTHMHTSACLFDVNHSGGVIWNHPGPLTAHPSVPLYI